MTAVADRRLAGIALFFGVVFVGVFAGLVIFHGLQLRAEIRQKMIARDAAVLSPVAQQQVESGASLAALLPDARRKGMLAMAIFDEAGVTVDQVPASQPLVELPIADFIQLQNGLPIARFFPDFSLAQLGPRAAPGPRSPVLEIIVPLYRAAGPSDDPAPPPSLLGFVRYYLDARTLADELTLLDDSVRRKTITSLSLGLALISLIIVAAYLALGRAQRTIAERTARLVRSNFELALSAKASALGQLTSHLVHGLQGSVAGLHALTARRNTKDSDSDWKTAAAYTKRMQGMIQETIALLGDSSTHTSYELTGHEIVAIIRRRNTTAAEQKGVICSVEGGFDGSLDSHRAGLVCLIANNLAQNAIEATAASRKVTLSFGTNLTNAILQVIDEGPGISREQCAHLFEPGRSGRAGGTGLGLAISQLLARQLGAKLALESTGPTGSTFSLTVPLIRE